MVAGLSVRMRLMRGKRIATPDLWRVERCRPSKATSMTNPLPASCVTSPATNVSGSVFDTGANVFVATATTHGAAGIVAVLSALYPVVTVVLAWLVLGERLSASKRTGGVVALAGAALVAAG